MVEISAIIFTLVSVIYAMKKSILNWTYGIMGIIFYGILFFQMEWYSNLSLQFIFLAQSIYGLWKWNSLGKINAENMKVEEIVVSFTLLIGIFLVFRNVFPHTMMIDSITSSISVVALYLLTNRKIENWILWIIADVFYVIGFSVEGKYLSAILYSIFLVLCVIGYKKWKKLNHITSTNN